MKLSESHLLKKWMKSIAAVRPLNVQDQKRKTFVTEIINSQFNLITDLKVRNEIINLLGEIPETTIPEQMLKSYLYIMIGNVTRSDNILKTILNTPPRVNWEKTGHQGGLYHQLAINDAARIFSKLARHPADRKIFQLLALYFQSYYNDESLLMLADQVDTSEVEKKIGLKVIQSMAPSLSHFLLLSDMPDNRRYAALRGKKFDSSTQSYWFWPFMEIDPLISLNMTPELARIESSDQLWFIYLLENEKLADIYSKKSGRTFLPGRRPFLKEGLLDNQSFMMSLYKLIELGDINQDLVVRTTDYLIQ